MWFWYMYWHLVGTVKVIGSHPSAHCECRVWRRDSIFTLVKITLSVMTSSPNQSRLPSRARNFTHAFHSFNFSHLPVNFLCFVLFRLTDWQPNLGLAHVLKVIWCLLLVPFPESALNDEAGRLFMESYEDYCRKAAMMTRYVGVGACGSSSSSSSLNICGLGASLTLH